MSHWYTPRPVPPRLAADLVCTWTATPAGEHRLVPDGCVDVVWLDDGRAWLCGTETEAWTFRLPPGLAGAGVRFRPAVAAAVFGVGGDEIADRRVPLDAVLPTAAAQRLAERLLEAAPHDRHAALLDEASSWLARAAHPVDPVAIAAVACAVRPRRSPVDELADALGLSPRQLHRRCTRAFGYGATTLTRILRLQRFLALSRTGPSSLAELAARAGYADQAHLARDCRRIAGVTPSALVAEMSDPFKTTAAALTTLGA